MKEWKIKRTRQLVVRVAYVVAMALCLASAGSIYAGLGLGGFDESSIPYLVAGIILFAIGLYLIIDCNRVIDKYNIDIIE